MRLTILLTILGLVGLIYDIYTVLPAFTTYDKFGKVSDPYCLAQSESQWAANRLSHGTAFNHERILRLALDVDRTH